MSSGHAEIGFSVDLGWLRQMTRQYPVVAREEMVRVMGLIMARLEAEVAEKTPKGAGGAAGLLGSIFHEVNVRGEAVIGVVGSPLEYAEPVEFGTRPHFPPARPLILWAARKLGLSGRELRSAVRGIQWKIYRHGTKGKFMFTKTFEEQNNWIDEMLDSIGPRIARRVNDGAS